MAPPQSGESVNLGGSIMGRHIPCQETSKSRVSKKFIFKR
jgi:hypothetical protein